jgi:hypothetical protein
VRGNDAEAHSYFVRLDAKPDDTSTLARSFGRYRDKLIRNGDGRWRIRERVAEPDAFLGVEADARLGGGPEKRLSADPSDEATRDG